MSNTSRSARLPGRAVLRECSALGSPLVIDDRCGMPGMLGFYLGYPPVTMMKLQGRATELF